MKPKKNERTKQGHRQPYTKVEISSIKLGAGKEEKADAKVETKATETKATTPKTTAKAATKKTATKK